MLSSCIAVLFKSERMSLDGYPTKKIDSDRNLFDGIIAHYVAEIEQIMNKGKVAVDDVTLWANCCTKCHGNTISRFHLIAYYVTG